MLISGFAPERGLSLAGVGWDSSGASWGVTGLTGIDALSDGLTVVTTGAGTTGSGALAAVAF